MLDYRELIKEKEARLKLLKFLRPVPNRLIIPIQYYIKTGRKLNLRRPERYTEKIQWYKLYYRDEEIKRCSDKYQVRSFLEERGCGELLNELYAVHDSADEIRFDELPDSFAMKLTAGSGMNYFTRDKKKENLDELRKLAGSWLRSDSFSYGREWGYKDAKSRLIFEKFLPRDENNDLPDYKFFCFDGRPYCLYVMVDAPDGGYGRCGFYDMNFQRLEYSRTEYGRIMEPVPKPENFERMAGYAAILSSGFPHVRVDFYDVGGRIVFGELTFYTASGYTVFEPDEFDFILGEQFKIFPGC